jgi:hypothetical protein
MAWTQHTWEGLIGEMTVLGSPAVDGVGQVEFLDNDTRPHVEVGLDNFNKLIR